MRLLFLMISVLFAPGISLSQEMPAPDVEIQRQQSQLESLRSRLETTADTLSGQDLLRNAPSLPVDEVPCFVITQVLIDGGGLLTGNLLPLLTDRQGNDSPINHCIGGQGVKILRDRLQNILIEKGFTTSRVYVFDQDISGGTVSLKIIPGRIRSIRWKSTQDKNPYIGNVLPLAAGDVLDLRILEQCLENFRRLNSIQISFQIVPADKDNESDIIIDYQQKSPLHVSMTLDDDGNKSTGRYQGSLTLSADNLAGMTDFFYMSWQQDAGNKLPGARGSSGYTVHYDLPWQMWNFSLTTNHSKYYRTVFGFNQDYIYHGSSSVNEVALSRVVQRSAYSKTQVAIKGFHRSSNNFIDDTEIEVQRRKTAGWELSGSHRHHLASSILDVNLAFKRGTGAFGAEPAPEELFDEGNARMQLAVMNLNFQSPFVILSKKFYYIGKIRNQWGFNKLTVQDQFCIGGRHSVRGFYGKNSICSESGIHWQNEIIVPYKSLQPYFGFDWGAVRGSAVVDVAKKTLAGIVVGLRGQLGSLQYDLFTSKPIGHHGDVSAPKSVSGFNLSLQY